MPKDFPRNLSDADGRAFRSSILSQNPDVNRALSPPREPCIRTSIQTISEGCLGGCWLWDVTFEPGSQISILGESEFQIRTGVSKLSHLGDRPFAGRKSLQAICFPAGLHQITGLALAGSAVWILGVEKGSEFWRVSRALLVGASEMCLIRCSGQESEVTVPKDDAEAILTGCFSGCHFLLSVEFAPNWKVSILGRSAFPGAQVFNRSVSLPR
jgi:hypothetical protein